MSFSFYHFKFLLKTSQVYILLLNNLFNPKVLCMSCPVIILCSRSFFKLDCTESRKEIQGFTPHVFIKTESEIWFLSKFNSNFSQRNEANVKYLFTFFSNLELYFRNGILLPKLFWSTMRKNCSSDREKLLKFKQWKVRTIFGNRMLF